MSEQFPSIRHLAGYVKTELNRFQQLDAAVSEILALSETLADRKAQLAEYEAKITAAQTRLHDATAMFDRFTADVTGKRRELQALYQQEQQERQKARDAFEAEKTHWQDQANEKRAVLSDLGRQLGDKQRELDGLQKRLQETVEAALSKR